MEIFYNVVLFLAGLGIFMKSMDMLGKNMQSIFGAKVREKMQKFASKPFVGALMGMGGTIALQSGTAMVVLIMSFVQIGAVSISQTLPLIIGVNAGGSLIFASLLASGFNLSIVLSALALIGVFITIFAKNKKIKDIGETIFSLGLLFLGLYLICYSMSFLKSLDFVSNLFLTITNPILLVLIGLLIALLFQSSLATNAVIISLCTLVSGDIGLSVQSALWLSAGSRIGPTFITFFASIGKSKAIKSVAMLYFLFNVIALILFAISSFTGWTVALENALKNPALIIVIFNIICSFTTAILLFVFIKPLTVLMHKILKFRKNKDDVFEMDENLLNYPDLCIGQLGAQFENLFNTHTKNLKNLIKYLLDKEATVNLKNIINDNKIFYDNIERVKINLSKIDLTLSDSQKIKIYYYVDVLGRFHSLADRTNKIISLFPEKPTKDFAKKQLDIVGALCDKLLSLNSVCKKILLDFNLNKDNNCEFLSEAFEIDSEITKYKLESKECIIKSYQSKNTDMEFADKYARLVNQLEQMGEHYSAICICTYDSESKILKCN